MNTLIASILTPIALLLPLQAQEAPHPPPPPLTTAVFDFADGDVSVAGMGSKVGALLNALLSAEEGLLLVERQELEKVLAEQELQLSGTIDPATAVGIGRLTGARLLVTGRAFKVGGETYLVAKVISAETGRVFGQTARFEDDASLGDAATVLAAKIGAIARERRGDLVSPAETPEERIARLKKLVPEGAKLPAVFVGIPEQHLAQHIPDPAAQTEVLLVLQELGFPITDSPDKAKIKIMGEAFSERAGARGGLISCRARVEIKAKDKGGKLLFVDRQTQVAVDVAEHIAAKSAVQEAGAELAGRIVARLVN